MSLGWSRSEKGVGLGIRDDGSGSRLTLPGPIFRAMGPSMNGGTSSAQDLRLKV